MEAFEAYVAANQDRFMEELGTLCAQPSISAQGVGLTETALLVEERLRELGAQVRLLAIDDSPPIVSAEIGAGARTLLVYNHYDVQPPGPLDEWQSPPFKLAQRDGRLYARGVADDKGDLLCRLQAIEAYQRSVGPLPLRIRFLIEGEEEVGSPHLETFAKRYPELLLADGCLWETGGKDAARRFALELGVKGLCYVELSVRTAASDLHSSWGTVVPDAAWRMVWALSTLKTADERIQVEGLMERVCPPSDAERAHLASIPFDAEQARKDYGISGFVGNVSGTDLLQKHFYEPTCTISGLSSGYIEKGLKTVLPCTAMAKVSFRLVPDLTPGLVVELLREHLRKRGFGDVEVKPLGGAMPARSAMDAPFVQACIAAAKATYGTDPIIYPTSPGSGPLFHVCRGTAAVSAGVSHANSLIHAPNENIFLEDYLQGIRFVGETIRLFAGR